MTTRRVLLLQLDGKLPNIALMRISAHHKALGDEVELRRIVRPERVERNLFDADDHDLVYASLIFTKTRPLALRIAQLRPDAFIGGTGWDCYEGTPQRISTLEQIGITTTAQDYSLYPAFRRSIGFTQRGCRMTTKTCPWCSVPYKEGKVRAEKTINEIWRGEPYPRELLLLDNDPFGVPDWRDMIETIREGNFAVCFNQGINIRMITDETAAAIASINLRDDNFKKPCVYTAWDSSKDETVLFRGLNALVKYGIKPDNIMVYMLIAYDQDQDEADWLYRQQRLRQFGCRPFPMPFVRNLKTIGFQRWVVHAYDKRISWSRFKAARYQPKNLSYPAPTFPELTESE